MRVSVHLDLEHVPLCDRLRLGHDPLKISGSSGISLQTLPIVSDILHHWSQECHYDDGHLSMESQDIEECKSVFIYLTTSVPSLLLAPF